MERSNYVFIKAVRKSIRNASKSKALVVIHIIVARYPF